MDLRYVIRKVRLEITFLNRGRETTEEGTNGDVTEQVLPYI